MSDDQLAELRGDERRDYFRVNDAVALQVEVIDEAGLADVEARFDGDRLRFGLSNFFAHCGEQLLPRRKQIESRYPDVAEYLEALEERLELVASVLSNDGGVDGSPSHVANISGSGIDFTHHRPLSEGAHVLLRMVLFPQQARIMAIAKVVHGSHGTEAPIGESPSGSQASGKFRIGLHFERIHEEDRERLIKHIHSLQMQSLRTQQG